MSKNYFIDHYKVLGLPQSATQEQIKRAYHMLARQYHPDVNPATVELFKNITVAYNTLSNPASRQQYDCSLNKAQVKLVAEKLKAYKEHERLKNFFQAQDHDYQTIKNLQNELNHKRNSKLSNSHKLTKWLKDKLLNKEKKNHLLELSLSLKDVFFGTTRNITFPNGKKGRLKISAGAQLGQIIKVKIDNEHDYLFVVTEIETAKFIHFEDKKIIIDLPITLNEAINGATIKVPTLTNFINLKIPPNSNSGDLLRVQKQGIKTSNSLQDLFIKLLIQIPKNAKDLDINKLTYGADIRSELFSFFSILRS